MEINFAEGCEPRLKTGDVFYDISRNKKEYVEVKVSTVVIELLTEEGKELAFCTGYKGDRFNFRSSKVPDTIFYKDDIFYEKEDVERAIVWTPINSEEYDWESAIGDRGTFSHEDSELGICCSLVSEIRDQLLLAKKNNGINQYQKDVLNNCLKREYFDDDLKNRLNLLKILNGLGCDV